MERRWRLELGSRALWVSRGQFGDLVTLALPPGLSRLPEQWFRSKVEGAFADTGYLQRKMRILDVYQG